MQNDIIEYKIVNIKKETEDVFTLTLSSGDNTLNYIPGQVITIYFQELDKNKGREYSISSAPSERCISITVKRVGIFSKMITSKKVGDILLGSLPYGYFYSESVDVDAVFIAGGVGVAPFRSMIVESVRLKPSRKISLFYSNKKIKDIVFKEEFDALAARHKNIFNLNYYLTKEKFVVDNIKSGRIPIKDILEKKSSNSTEFFICGSKDFVRSYHELLSANGVGEAIIFTEDFF